MTTLTNWRSVLPRRPRAAYVRRRPLVLINGLAEQAESWYCNVPYWRRRFDLHQPNLLAFDSAALHRRIEAGLAIDVDYLVRRLRHYLHGFVQAPPYHLVANSLGGKIAVEFAARYPDQVGRLVLLCPSGLSAEERLPLVAGVRHNDVAALLDTVFWDRECADAGVLSYYQRQFANRRWKLGLLRTIRGTMPCRVRDRLPRITQPTLLVVGREDRIVAPDESIAAASLLPRGRVVVLNRCGHAPQIEKANRVNRLVMRFLSDADN